MEQERRKERKNVLKERKNDKKIIKVYFKKEKKKPGGFKLAKPVLLVFLAAAG